MTDFYLHIICLDVPYPADYGGAQAMLFTIQALHAQGVKIHLHCFDYGRGRQPMLLNWSESITYYERKEGAKGFRFNLPYIVSSRANDKLLHNLLQDDYPILMEGVHCTYWLKDERLAKRKIIVHLHNVEFTYYKHLQKTARNLFKKIYFWNECRLLKHYEKWIAGRNLCLVTMSNKDETVYRNDLGAKNVTNIPAFLGASTVKSREGMGNFCLYHGNLLVTENEQAAIWLLQHVFNELAIPFVIAGKNPSTQLTNLAHEHQHTCIVANLSEHEMQDLIAKAQINILPSFNSTGVKFKLMNALFHGRHCVVNEAAIEGSGLAGITHVANSVEAMRNSVKALYEKAFTADEIEERKKVLADKFDSAINAQKLITLFGQM